MKNVAEYRKYADDCRKLAKQTPALSDALLKMADAWSALADSREETNSKATGQSGAAT